MSFEKEYQQKLVSADQAVQTIKSGDVVKYGHFLSSCITLDRTHAKRLPELKDLRINGGAFVGISEVIKADPAGEHMR